MPSRLTTFIHLAKPPAIRWSLWVLAVLGGYDLFCNQFGLPTARSLWGMTGSLLPWWGWLLIAHAIGVYALFEYVRRLPLGTGGLDSEGSWRVKLDEHKSILRLEVQQLEVKLKVLADDLDVLKASVEITVRETSDKFRVLERMLDEQREIIDDKLHAIHVSLRAIYTRELLEKAAEVIRQDFSAMCDRLLSGEAYDAIKWQQWEEMEVHWRRKLEDWVHIASSLLPDVRASVYEFSDERYREGWTISDTQFPSAEAVRCFKKARITYRQWEEAEKKVDTRLIAIAY